MSVSELFALSIGIIFVNNIVLFYGLGLCPFTSVTRNLSSAFSTGLAVIFVMTVGSALCTSINTFALIPFHAEYLQTIAYILVVSSLAKGIELALEKWTPVLYESIGLQVPFIALNCAVFGIILMSTGINPATGLAFDVLSATLYGFAGGCGFLITLILMAGLRERLELANVPQALKGEPIAFIVAGLMALAFLGFTGFSFIK